MTPEQRAKLDAYLEASQALEAEMSKNAVFISRAFDPLTKEVFEKPKTVRVRVAVAVDKNGFYSAYGCSSVGDDYCARIALEGSLYGKTIVWIEADVPLPVTETIEGKVV